MNETPKEVIVKNYIRCDYESDKIITVGRTDEGNFILNVTKNDDSGKETVANMILTEDSFYAMFTSMMIFTEHHGINMTDKMNQLIHNEKVKYICSPPDAVINQTTCNEKENLHS